MRPSESGRACDGWGDFREVVRVVAMDDAFIWCFRVCLMKFGSCRWDE
jgi:hypothetical protein